MEAAKQARTIAQDMLWAVHMLDYTDEVCDGLTDENMGHRPTNPAGGYFFSAGEQVMHIADTRWDCLGWIDGKDYSKRKFAGDYPGKDKPWQFRAASSKDILASLKESRDKLNEVLAGSSATLMDSTPGSLKSYQEGLDKAKEKGNDTAQIEAEGPSNLANILLFLVSHEQAHRAVMQTTLRMNNVEVHRVG